MISIIIPCYNEEKFIAECLDSVIAQDYPSDDIEILVIDGMSKDNTRKILKNYKVMVLDNPKRIKPCALNIGVKQARGKLIMIMDAHATYKKDYISKCVKYSKEYNTDNVGGVVETVPFRNTLISKAITVALSHSFGVGGSQFRKGVSKPQQVDTVFCGCYKRDVFERIGLFNENLVRSQDMEFNLRLKKNGGKILLMPDIISYYYPKDNLKDFFLHNIKDGIWATYPLKFIKTPLKLRHYIPLIFVITLPISIWVYLPVAIFFSFQIARKKQAWRYFFALPIVFASRHIGYGIGSIWGLIKILI